MKRFALLALALLPLLLTQACSEQASYGDVDLDNADADTATTTAPGVVVQPSEIRSLVIEDFNWEAGVTKTYTVTDTGISLTDDRDLPDNRWFNFTPEQAEEYHRLLGQVGTIYVGSYRDEETADGVFVTFHFHMSNHVVLTTRINNIHIDSYAALTAFLSGIASPEHQYTLEAIHYHQYENKDISEVLD